MHFQNDNHRTIDCGFIDNFLIRIKHYQIALTEDLQKEKGENPLFYFEFFSSLI